MFHPDKIVWNFSNPDKLFHIQSLDANSAGSFPFPQDERDFDAAIGSSGIGADLDRHIAERDVTAFMVLQNGKIRCERYFKETGPKDTRISWSMSKSVTALLLGILMDRGVVPEAALEYQIQDHVPLLKDSAYDGARLRHVLTMSSGAAFNEDYLDYFSDINRLGRVIAAGGSLDDFAAGLARARPPGSNFCYVSVDTHVIGMMIRALTGKRIVDLLNTYLVEPMGFEGRAYMLSDNLDEPFVLGGLNLCTRDYARIAQMMLQRGEWQGRRILSEAWVDRMTTHCAPEPAPELIGTPAEPLGYGMQWWIPPDPMPGEFYGVGIYGQYIYVNRACDLVIAQNAADRSFRDGDGAVNIRTLALFRRLAQNLA